MNKLLVGLVSFFMIAAFSIAVVVPDTPANVEVPTIVDVEVEGDVVTLTFTSVRGGAYYLQKNTDLLRSGWVKLSNPIVATGTLTVFTTTADDDVVSYRVVRVDPTVRLLVCHDTGSGRTVTLRIPQRAVLAHLEHGDTLGRCE